MKILVHANRRGRRVPSDMPGAQLTVSDPPSGLVRGVLTRAHHEFVDTDGLFVTYWERYYDRGGALMGTFNKGYYTIIEYGNIVTSSNEKNPCFVGGKGIKPCYGEEVSWTTSSTPDADYFGVYGWLRDPLVEYYIGRSGGAKIGTYTTSRGTYTLYIDHKNQENIINPDPPGSKFLQFNCDGAKTGTINMAEHYSRWETVIAQKGWTSNSGWDWHSITTPDYCVVATEVWQKRGGDSGVTNIKFDYGMSVTPQSIRVSAAGNPHPRGAYQVKVRSSGSWYILSAAKPSRVTVSRTTGSRGVSPVNIWVSANTTGKSRTANMALVITWTNATYAFISIVQLK